MGQLKTKLILHVEVEMKTFEKQKILIVDDRKENLFVLKQALSDLDAEIVEAQNGNDALAATLDHHFAVAILDVMMPGMNGYELAEYLRGDERTKIIPIIFVTAADDNSQQMFKGYESGGIDYIVKPYNPQVLLGKVKLFLEMDNVREELRRHRDKLDLLVAERTSELEEEVRQHERAERELLRAKEEAEEVNRLKMAFLNNMSHEIRTPMNGVMGLASLMVEASAEEKEEYACIIQKCAGQLLTLIDDVILLSRLQSESLVLNESEFVPAELVSDIYRIFTMSDLTKGLDISVSIPASLRNLKVKADADKVKQVLTNLVSNSAKYTSKGGIDIGFNMENGLLEFYVKDTGMGIPENEQKLIFDNFYRGEKAMTAAIRGTGLGLCIAKEMVNAMGGQIGVESEPDKGSRFFFTVRVEKMEDASCPKEAKSEDYIDFSKLIVLVVEDEPVNYQYLELALKNQVKCIDHAANGLEAVQFVMEKDYDFILMDIKMPVMNGFEATEKIKNLRPDIPVIVQTAHAGDEEKEMAFLIGCDDYIAKPFKKNELLETVSRIIKNRII